MPSKAHQWLLLWIARKMTADGYLVAGCDGRIPQGGVWNFVPKPFLIAGSRPDVWGVSSSGRIAIGEAKTAGDVLNEHTRQQLRVFTQILQKGESATCRLYLAVPESAANALAKVLGSISMATRAHIFSMLVPDCLLVSEIEDIYESA